MATTDWLRAATHRAPGPTQTTIGSLVPFHDSPFPPLPPTPTRRPPHHLPLPTPILPPFLSDWLVATLSPLPSSPTSPSLLSSHSFSFLPPLLFAVLYQLIKCIFSSVVTRSALLGPIVLLLSVLPLYSLLLSSSLPSPPLHQALPAFAPSLPLAMLTCSSLYIATRGCLTH